MPTPAQRCLVRAATAPTDEIEAALQEWRSLVDLSGPIDGGSYRLIPIVFHRLQAAGLEDPNRGMFKGVYRRSMIENSCAVDAVTPALRALVEADIVPWLAKGAALVLAGYYPTLASRPMADVDIVVDFPRRDDAIEVLRSLGYAPTHSSREMAVYHAATFVDTSGTEIDLHWHFLNHARSVAADEILSRAPLDIALNGVPLRVPGPTGLLIATVVHGLSANREPPVRWLVDAAMILDHRGEQVAWDDVVEFASRFRLARRMTLAFELLAEITGRAAPESTIAALAAVPTSTVERLEGRMTTAPWNSIRGRVFEILAGYAGGDRELKNVTSGLPRYLAGVWNVEHRRQMPVMGGRKLVRLLRRGRL